MRGGGISLVRTSGQEAVRHRPHRTVRRNVHPDPNASCVTTRSGPISNWPLLSRHDRRNPLPAPHEDQRLSSPRKTVNTNRIEATARRRARDGSASAGVLDQCARLTRTDLRQPSFISRRRAAFSTYFSVRRVIFACPSTVQTVSAGSAPVPVPNPKTLTGDRASSTRSGQYKFRPQ